MEQNPTIKLAIADDHIMMRKGIMGIIASLPGFEVIIEADNGRDLLDQLAHSRVLPDICILDIGMSVMNGYETQIAIRKHWPEIKTLVLTMYHNEFSIIKMIKNGANGYVLKASPPQELEKALTGIHQHGFYHSELVSNHFLQMIKNKDESTLPRITDKELEFLKYCCTELHYKEIAAKLEVSVRTVHGYRDALFAKLSLKTRIGLVMYAINIGIVPVNYLNMSI